MDIGSLIPHRPPFLFVDEVVKLEPGRVVTRTQAREDADFFSGHYPGNPIMPGVLVCECAFQAGALLLAANAQRSSHHEAAAASSIGKTLDQPEGFLPVLTRIKSAAFKRIVRPGDWLDIEVVIDESLDDAYFMTGRVSVGGKLAVRVEFACTLTRAAPAAMDALT